MATHHDDDLVLDNINENIDARDLNVINEEALRFYNNRAVTKIVKCVSKRLWSRDPGVVIENQTGAKEAGILLHTYIHEFYIRFANREGVEEFVSLMLEKLKHDILQRIEEDIVVTLQPKHSSPRLDNVHMDLTKELIQFFTFVKKSGSVIFRTESSLVDPIHDVRGRYDALFRMKKYNYDDDNLVLVDWLRSANVNDTKILEKTLQLNIYKFILEKYERKNIIKMFVIVFHRNNENYKKMEIQDTGFSREYSKHFN